jgi:hypothetical protein
MEILCECGHRLRDHEESQGGCWYHYFGGSCYCNLLPETVEARYWGKWAYRQTQAAIRSTNHWMIIASKQKTEYAELQEQLRMCQFALREMDKAHVELVSYTKIAVDALKKALQSADWLRDYPYNTAVYNDLQEALSKIKGKF